MKRRRLLLFSLLALPSLIIGAWWIVDRFTCRLHAVEIERPGGEVVRTADPEFLRRVEVWRQSIEGPSLRQRWLRATGAWIENGVRQPDYEVTLVFTDGRRE